MSCKHESKYPVVATVSRTVKMQVNGKDVDCTQYGTDHVVCCSDCGSELSKTTSWGGVDCP